MLQFLSLHIDDILYTATKMATLPVSSGDKTSADSLEKQWGLEIKYFRKQALEDINVEEYIFHFHENCELLNGSGVQAVQFDNRPYQRAVDLRGALEIRMTEWIKEMHGMRKPAIRKTGRNRINQEKN